MGIKAGQGSPWGFNLGWRAGRTQWERRRTRDRNTVGRQNEKTDLVPCGGGVEQCTGHYVEQWYRKSELCGPNPASRTLLWLSLLHSASVSLYPRSVSFPHVLETLEVREAPSHTLSPYSALNLIASVSAGKTFHFWSVCIFPALDSVTHCGLTRKKKKKNFSEAATLEQFCEGM